MRFLKPTLVLIAPIAGTFAAPTDTITVVANSCTNPATRQEWRTLSKETQTNYMDAVKCLTTKPSRLGLSTSLYDDFPYVHTKMNVDIHFVAQFLPYHRYFVHLYEGALEECGYTGTMPYWDWTQDAGKLLFSSVVEDFGGNGLYGGWTSPARPNPLVSCVQSGPMANRTMPYYDGGERPHCLNRQINNGTGSAKEAMWRESSYTPEKIKNITETSDDFPTFWVRLENEPHGAIHNSLGGDMGPSTSPNDPLFMMHHSQIDRLWWLWQQAESPAREKDFSGKRIDKTEATLQDVLDYMGLGTNTTIESIMSTQADVLCYTYI